MIPFSCRMLLGAFFVLSLVVPAAGMELPVPATEADLYLPGTQPNSLMEELIGASDCAVCHSNYGAPSVEPHMNWEGSMMGQSARDPLFWAAVAVANQDVESAGTGCLRCHAPKAWLEGRALQDGSALTPPDFHGVQCSFCHRMVDPEYEAGISPIEDGMVLKWPLDIPASYEGGMYVVDPADQRRGPWDLKEFWYLDYCSPSELCDHGNPHRPLPWALESDFHRQSALCGTCHDVINPLFSGDSANGYPLDTLNAPIEDPSSGFPEQRTFTEWSLSQYASSEGVYAPQYNPLVNQGTVHTCQDCHMASAADAASGVDRSGGPCFEGPLDPCPDRVQHDLVPVHDLTGANTWVPLAILEHPIFGAQVDEEALLYGIERATQMLNRSASLLASWSQNALSVRVINETGHKLPTGYPEGRQMWISVNAYNATGRLVFASGSYDDVNGTLLMDVNLMWFGTKQGLDDEWAQTLGMDAGPSFHVALNNKIHSDSRIPPRGYDISRFAAAGIAPVGSFYQTGQFWADKQYVLPSSAARAEIAVRYQTTSRDYVEFLADENVTNGDGQLIYDLWRNTGKSTPVTLVSAKLQRGGSVLTTPYSENPPDAPPYSFGSR